MNDNEINQPVDDAEHEEIGEAGIKGASVALSILGNAMSEIVKNVDISTNLSNALDSLASSIRASVAEICFKPLAGIIGEAFKNAIRTGMIDEAEAAGRLGWCFYNIDGLADDFSVTYFREKKNAIDNSETTLAKVDEDLSKLFTKEIVESICLDTEMLLLPEDKIKFQKAMIDFNEERYYASANLLAGLIDAQSIKEILFHGNPGDNLSQGWKAFAIAYKNKYSNALDTTDVNPKDKNRESDFPSFIETNKNNDTIDTELIMSHCSIGYSLLALFHNSDWHDYPHSKPQMINRHWLAHGMYDYDDVKKSDCLKLLFILNQVASLYQ